MPALRLLGRKWLTSTDDLVYPGLFELCVRTVWLAVVVAATARYWPQTRLCTVGGELARGYLVAKCVHLSLLVVLLTAIVNRSAQGAVMDIQCRKHVPALLTMKIGLLLPEMVLNVIGTMFAFCEEYINCPSGNTDAYFTWSVVEALVIFEWALLGLALFGLALVFDPVRPGDQRESRSTSVWARRIRWAFCCLRSDEHGHEAFQQVAQLLSSLFRLTDLVPSDVVAGCVLLRVKQKRETRERRRLHMLADSEPRYTTELERIVAMAPRWMCLRRARRLLVLCMAAYGWPYVLYRHCGTALCRLAPRLSCCACHKPAVLTGDNCCLCHLAAVRYTAEIETPDILYASFRNHVFELPFCVVADHDTSSIVVAIRGSISLRDVLTDLTAASARFPAEGMPPDTTAHRGMSHGARYIERKLRSSGVLDKARLKYPRYELLITGHSLGAGVAVLLGILLRPEHPDLKVFAFGTPAGLISREAARVTESFVFTVGVGHDVIMRLGVDSTENFRTSIIETLHATRLPKYRILLNGFGYMLFGVPPTDLETTWRDEHAQVATVSGAGRSPLLERGQEVRFSRTRLYTAGRILHIVMRKRTKQERKSGTGGPTYEMRWAKAEDFIELEVMPRMVLDHLPDHIYDTIDTVLGEQKESHHHHNHDVNQTIITTEPEPMSL